jgi:hypothetical protein
MSGLFSILMLLPATGSEGPKRLRIKTLTHQTFGFLRLTSLSHGNMSSPEFVGVEMVQG